MINTIYPILKNSDGSVILDILDNISANQINIKRTLQNIWELNLALFDKNSKLDNILNDNLIESDGQDFRIVYTQESTSDNGNRVIGTKAYHISYDLNDPNFILPSFASTGTPTAVLTDILSGTGFTVGTVEATSPLTFAVNEQVTRRRLVELLANAVGGEVDYNNKVVNIPTQIGLDNGFQFRNRKNLQGITVIRDNRKATNVVSYSINIIELQNSEEYKRLGYENLESFGFGDTIKVIEDRTSTDISIRVVEYTYNPLKKKNSSVVLSNVIDDITNDTTAIKSGGIFKDKVYNGIKISPEVGIQQTLSNQLARTTLDSQVLSMQKGDGFGGYTDAIYFDVIGGVYKINGTLEAVDGVFSGTMEVGTNFKVKVFETATNGVIDLLDGVTQEGRLSFDAVSGVLLQSTSGQLTLASSGGRTLINALTSSVELFANTSVDIFGTLSVDVGGANLDIDIDGPIGIINTSGPAGSDITITSIDDVFIAGDEIRLNANSDIRILPLNDAIISAVNSDISATNEVRLIGTRTLSNGTDIVDTVTAGSGLSGGGSGPNPSLSVDTSTIATRSYAVNDFSNQDIQMQYFNDHLEVRVVSGTFDSLFYNPPVSGTINLGTTSTITISNGYVTAWA